MQRFYFQYQTEAMPQGISTKREEVLEGEIFNQHSCGNSYDQWLASFAEETTPCLLSTLNYLDKFLLKYLTVAEILLVCNQTNFRANECRVKLALQIVERRKCI